MTFNPFKKQSKTTSNFGYWLRNNFAVDYEQHIQALVYFGAAFLVIIVGLRGLGDLRDVSFVPRFLLNANGKIQSNIVMIGLFVEFTMLCLLAAVAYFTPAESKDDIQNEIRKLTDVLDNLSGANQTEAAQKVMDAAIKTSRGAEELLSSEIEILNDFRNKLNEKLLQLDHEISQVRQQMSEEVIGFAKSFEEFIQNEKDTIKRYNELVENLTVEAISAFRYTSQIVTDRVTKTFDSAEKTLNRQNELVEKFYSVNSKLLSETKDSYQGYIKNFSEMVTRENQRLNWLTANQSRPEEFMLNMIKTNERLITHLENIDNTIKIIANQTSPLHLKNKRASFYRKMKIRWYKLFNEFQ